MHFVYIDDSQDENATIFAALIVPAEEWRTCFDAIKNFRRGLKESDSIPLYKEFHAWKFVSGRGNLGPNVVPKGRRCEIFKESLSLVASLPSVQILNCCLPHGEDEKAFERLLNRINRNMESFDSHAVLVCDEGKEERYIKLVRKMGVFNYVPSMFGAWDDGAAAKNLPISRILEDPFFKSSNRSYWIQMADFCAYALLRSEYPTSHTLKYGLEKAYNLLEPICVRKAFGKDPRRLGIIRGN